ncbi:MAG: DUF5107 domain-containing protein [Vicinamibacterales bacterium]
MPARWRALLPLVAACLAAAAFQAPSTARATTGQAASPARAARITEDVRTIATYPFSEPSPIPILTRDTRLYPYHAFEGYAHEATPRPWKVVHLENELIEVFVLPEVGGKVWGARVKRNGHEFIYRNEVLKFRNIALRGPWTSGGIEFNFGVIGHAPSTATPVDYVLRTNADGSVSCIVGAMDLPSRTDWRVEIRLPADSAAFETRVLWQNTTPLEQPYYNWMTAAASATDDLEMSLPGRAYLQHSGAPEAWPVDAAGRYLPAYANNAFGPNKSYHVVGERHDFFGGYHQDAGWGFGHWAPYEDMPGQKLWVWALSRAGGIWEDLLTDTDGQYVEWQAGRLFVQYSPGADVNPITQAAFDPLATDRWAETWFPVEGIGGLTAASSRGAMAVREVGRQLEIGVNAFRPATDRLRVWSGDTLVLDRNVSMQPLEPFGVAVDHDPGSAWRVELPALGLRQSSDRSDLAIARPFDTDPTARASIPAEDREVFEARELIKARRYEAARPRLEAVLASRPWHRGARLAMADLELRRGRYGAGLDHVRRVLQLDAYDADANFLAGTLYRALGRDADARDAFGWAARSMTYRSAANVCLAELAVSRGDLDAAERYARAALDFNQASLPAREVLAIVGRASGRRALADEAATALLDLDPLHHFVRAEAWLATPDAAAADRLFDGLRGEYPDQTMLELAIGYANRGRKDDAVALLSLAGQRLHNPLFAAWRAWLTDNPSALAGAASDVAFVFPFRAETLPVLTWAAGHDDRWTWRYLLALNLWARDRADEALDDLLSLGDSPDFAPLYVARSFLAEQASRGNPETDLRRAEELAGDDRVLRIPLIQYYQRHGRWADALAASNRARQRVPGDFNLDLLHARSLVNLGRAADAVAILDAVQVLPSENARESHQLYVQAHTMAALDALDAGRTADATAHLDAALAWPESLGQGRPYDPEERLVRYLLGVAASRDGKPGEARAAFEAVVTATRPVGGGISPLDALAVPALAALGRGGEIDAMLATPAAAPGVDAGVAALVAALRAASPEAVRTGLRGVAAAHPRLAGDLDGRLLMRALAAGAR